MLLRASLLTLLAPLALLAGCSASAPATLAPPSPPPEPPRCTGPGGAELPCRAPLVAHGSTTCQGLAGGGARCWGEPLSPPLPTGKIGLAQAHLPEGLADLAEVAIGPAAVCVRRRDVAVTCWRRQSEGAPRPSAVRVRFPAGITRVDQLVIDPSRPAGCARSGDRALCFELGEADAGGEALARPAEGLAEQEGKAQIFFDADGKLCARLEGGLVACPGARVAELEGAVDVASIGTHLCALLPGGQVLCGRLIHGVMAVAERWKIPSASRLVLGPRHGCALTSAGEVVCWGDGPSGQLGPGRLGHALPPAPVLGLPPAVALAAGDAHTCAEDASGAVRCWGANDRDQLLRPRRVTPPPLLLPAISGAVGLSSGNHFTCALIPDGKTRCWGGPYGPSPSHDASHWPEGQRAGSLSVASDWMGCSLVAGGARCEGGFDTEGAASNGGLIEGSALASRVAVVERNLSEPLACMLVPGGPPRCWGVVAARVRDSFAPPGGEGSPSRPGWSSERALSRWRAPTPVPELAASRQIADGAACFLMESGEVRSWFEECEGKRCRRVVRRAEGLAGATAVAGDVGVCCAIGARGEVACQRAERGHDTMMSDGSGEFSYQGRSSPSPAISLPGLSPARSIAVRGGGICAALENGEVRCGLVDGPTVTPFEGLSGAVEVTLGEGHGCARLEGGQVACWGSNQKGQLGQGAEVPVDPDIWPSPVTIGIEGSGR